MMVGRDRKIAYANAEMARLVGIPREAVLGASVETIHRFLGGSFVDATALASQETVLSLDASLRDRVELTFPRRAVYQRVVARVRESGGPLLGHIVLYGDVTHEVEVERAKSEFVSVASHELRTPMTSVKTSLSLLLAGAAGPRDASARELLEIAVRNADRMIRLINDLLDLSRLEAGRMEFQLEPVPLADGVAAGLETVAAVAQEQGVTVATKPPAEPQVVLGVRDRLVQVIVNLVSNAIKFSPRGGRVTVRWWSENGFAVTEVADQGPGIPADQLQAVFEPFRQLDSSTTREHGGAGLGLAISQELVARRAARLQELEEGRLPDFLPETRALRERDWTVAPIPGDLLERKVEITGPVDRKMVINALNSGASVFMADFEDAHSPTWENTVSGHQNLVDAVHGTIAFTGPDNRRYALNPRTAVLMVRPRGWHLIEKHLLVDGRPVSASLCDFGLCFFHIASKLVERGTGPYWYLPKLESHLEARLWNEVFNFAQDALGLARGTIRATVLIETILAAFETDEILYELRDHSAGLNCGRWDYIFSFIKKFRSRPDCVLPDRGRGTMDQPFLRAYAELVIQTWHRHGIHALGRMAAQIPIKHDPAANAAALEKVRQDKLRDVRQGHDGTWGAHPALVPVAREIFDAHVAGAPPLTGGAPGA